MKSLRDLHIWLTMAGEFVPVFNRPRAANANPSAHRAILGGLREAGRVQWAVTPDKVGFIAIYGWNDANVAAKAQEALEEMRATRGMIVDVRLNGGGGEGWAGEFAGRFLEKEFVYASSRYRTGPNHTDLTQNIPRTIQPRGPWRYDRPVVLLIGQKCMSSSESFVAMMSGGTNVIIMGDHTCGSSGNPKIINLPLDMTVSIPQWIDYLPDGTPLDERGFQPQIPFQSIPGAFEGTRDDLLAAALQRLRKEPLPDQPIAGPAFNNLPDHSAAVEEESKDDARPKVVAVFPADGASGVAAATELRVRFDRPMDSLSLKLDWESGGFLSSELPEYNPEKFEFTVPVHLAPGQLHQIVLNAPGAAGAKLKEFRQMNPRDGFQSSDHHLAGLYVWRFQTASITPTQPGDPPRVKTISPAVGSQVPGLTFVEIQFNQPMSPPNEALPYVVSSDGMKPPRLISRVDYDPIKYSFRLPLLLPPKQNVSIVLAGFRGADGIKADPVKFDYQVSDEFFTRAERDKMAADANDPQLLSLLETFKQERRKLTSLSERVQTIFEFQRNGLRNGLFTHMRATGSDFKWQQPSQYYSDVTALMNGLSAFQIGSDGQNCWFHHRTLRHGEQVIVCPPQEMGNAEASICDPFALTLKSSAAAASELGLSYAGTKNLGGASCPLIEAWSMQSIPEMTSIGTLTQWSLNRENGRPVEITQWMDAMIIRTRFLYDVVNKPLSNAAFAAPTPDGVTPRPPDALGDGYTNRIVIIRDGSDGRMSVRWGKQGSAGTSSSGLN